MGNQACSLPDGASGKALREMAGPQRIPITDRFWFELLKVQLPGIEQAGFFDVLYKRPEELDSLVHDAYFLQLVATNEHSGNFRTFLRFWARLLHYYRTSPRDAKPCGAATVLSLSLLCRCLLKHFVGTFTAPELVFQLEQAPLEVADATATQPDDGTVPVSYCGRRIPVKVAACSQSPGAVLDHFRAAFPDDAIAALASVERCALRSATDGETFAAADLAERIAETGAGPHGLVLCPGGVPAARSSVLRSVLREVADFLASSSFGAVNGASPSLLSDSDADGGSADGGRPLPARNLSVSPQTLQLQAILLEILLTLLSVLAPRYGPPRSTETGAAEGAVSRVDFCAPLLYGIPGRVKAPAQAAWTSPPQEVAAGAGGKDDSEAFTYSVAHPPSLGEAPCMPLLSALLEVLEEDESDEVRDTGAADGGAAAGFAIQEAAECFPASGGRARPGPAGSSRSQEHRRPGPRAEALFAMLLNCIWLEPRGASLPRPTKEVLCLFGGVGLPPQSAGSHGMAPAAPPAADGPSSPASDPKGDSKAAQAAAGRLGVRAPLVLLLLLFHEPQDHPAVSSAFADLSDPLLAGVDAGVAAAAVSNGGAASGASSSKADAASSGSRSSSRRGSKGQSVSAPVNFAQLLGALLPRLRDGLYSMLLYCLVQRNAGFRRYCLSRASADEVLVPVLEVLNQLPATTAGSGGRGGAEASEEAAPSVAPQPTAPAAATALLLSLLTLTGERTFCESASHVRLADGNRVLDHARPVRDMLVSSVLIAVVLRVAHWNFAACRSAFFNQAAAGILTNLAGWGVEQMHWYTAGRVIEVAQLLARNALKAQVDETASTGAAQADLLAEHRKRMVRELLRALLRLISSCLQVPRVARNCNLVYALQRAYPAQFAALESDEDFGASLRHIRAVTSWFQEQCAPGTEDGADDSAIQVARLEAAAMRLHGGGAEEVEASCSGKRFVFREADGSSAFFLPEVWREAKRTMPEHVCWRGAPIVRPTA